VVYEKVLVITVQLQQGQEPAATKTDDYRLNDTRDIQSIHQARDINSQAGNVIGQPTKILDRKGDCSLTVGEIAFVTSQ
jgi:hypothetical protein